MKYVPIYLVSKIEMILKYILKLLRTQLKDGWTAPSKDGHMKIETFSFSFTYMLCDGIMIHLHILVHYLIVRWETRTTQSLQNNIKDEIQIGYIQKENNTHNSNHHCNKYWQNAELIQWNYLTLVVLNSF